METRPTSVRITECADEIGMLLKDHDLAVPNPRVVTRFRFIATTLCGVDRYAAEKAQHLAGFAEQFYSVRKHASYPGGADQIYIDMLGQEQRIRSAVTVRANGGD
jgi:hypothetical protein